VEFIRGDLRLTWVY